MEVWRLHTRATAFNMQIEHLPNGNLRMTADNETRQRIMRLDALFPLGTYAAEAAFLADELQMRNRAGFQQTAPCSVGALTSAPMITDGVNVWAFMDYQVTSFLDLLSQGRETIWTRG